MRTLDTIKFAMMMETTTWSYWLTELMPLKSLSVKVIKRRLHCKGVSTKLMSMSWMAFKVPFLGLSGLSAIGKVSNDGFDYNSDVLGMFLFRWR